MFEKVFQNKIIRAIVLVEFFVAAGYGAVAPVFAIFIADFIERGSAEVAGFAVAIYLLVKAIFQLPVARFIDRTDGERDDFYTYFLGRLLFGLGIFLYLFAKTPTHVYLIQALLGFALALSLPAYYGIFTRHLDKHYESFEWSIYSVFSYSLATAFAGALGGIIATKFGFDTLFIVAGSLYLLASIMIFIMLHPRLAPRKKLEKPKTTLVPPGH